MLKPSMKIVLVGDGASGKTCMIQSYINDSFRNEYIPTVFDNYKCSVNVEGIEHQLSLWDTAGEDEYQILRPLSYAQCDIFLICFSVTERFQFENAVYKWFEELEKKAYEVPKIFIGTKIDLRDNFDGQEGVLKIPSLTEDEIEKVLMTRCGGARYFECSALTQEGLKGAFDHAIKAVLKRRTEELLKGRKKKDCNIF